MVILEATSEIIRWPDGYKELCSLMKKLVSLTGFILETQGWMKMQSVMGTRGMMAKLPAWQNN